MRSGPPIQLKPTPAAILLILNLTLVCISPGAKAEEIDPAKEPPSAGRIMEFIDTYHAYMEDRLRGPTIWFDNFFGDQRIEDEDPPSTYVRLRLAARYTEGEGFKFPVRLHANVVLPRVNRRLRLVAFGGSRYDELEQRSNDPLDSSLRTDEDQDRSRLGLRYIIYKSLRDRFHFGGGLTVGWPMEAYIRMRYTRLMHMGKQNVVRFSETGYWNTLHSTGETSRLDLERMLPADITGRLSLFASLRKNDSATTWGVESNFFRQLTAKSALSLDLGMYGQTSPDQITTYRIATRYRRNFLRPWLYFEIEPELLLPLEEDGKTRQALGVLNLALECQFFTSEKKTVPD